MYDIRQQLTELTCCQIHNPRTAVGWWNGVRTGDITHISAWYWSSVLLCQQCIWSRWDDDSTHCPGYGNVIPYFSLQKVYLLNMAPDEIQWAASCLWRSPTFPLNRGLVGTFWTRKISGLLPVAPRFCSCPACSLVSIPAMRHAANLLTNCI